MPDNAKFKTLENICDVPWLLKSHIHMNSPEQVIDKINKIIAGGRKKLQVIFDFDRTLTKHHENGIQTKSTFGVLESIPFSPPGMKEKMEENLKKYFPIEVDPNMTVEEKIPFMLEWWYEGVDLLKGLKWDPVEIENFLKRNQQPFRDGTCQCFQELQAANVPVLVFSAGIGDVVKPFLSFQGLLTSNVHVVSNFLKFEDGVVVGCLGDIIHVFNKNEQLIENSPYFEELAGRSNVILLGDSTGDAKMADGVPHDTVLKIGFLNTKIEQSLEQYKELFDIVLTDDQTMDVLHNILKPTLSENL